MPQSPESTTTIVVVAGGAPPDPRVVSQLPSGGLVLAADSGADHALVLGLTVAELIGDLDSVSDPARVAVEAAGGSVTIHPQAKDWTDLELALARATELGATRIEVVGGHGGRADHHASNLLLLGAAFLAGVEVVAWHGPARLAVVRAGDRARVCGPPASLLSLVPIGGAAGPITTTGLAFPLAGEVLAPGSTRGVSNVLATGEATVASHGGVLLAIQPDFLADLADLGDAHPSRPPEDR